MKVSFSSLLKYLIEGKNYRASGTNPFININPPRQIGNPRGGLIRENPGKHFPAFSHCELEGTPTQMPTLHFTVLTMNACKLVNVVFSNFTTHFMPRDKMSQL